MEIITLATIIAGFLGLILMNLQVNNQMIAESKEQFKNIKEDIKDLKSDIKETREDNKNTHLRIDNLNGRIDMINSELLCRIDRLSDSIYSQKQ